MLHLTLSTIRPFHPDDAASIAKHANNRNVWRNMRDLMPHPYSIEDANDFIAFATNGEHPTNFALEVEGKAVGGIGLRLKTDIERVGAEIGYWLGEPYWGRGILSEAVPVFTHWAVNEFELTRIEAIVFEWNPASAHILEKAGYVLEGTMRRSAIKDGTIIDRLLYAFIAEPKT